MLPYPTHAHPTTSARGHAYSHPNPNDQNFQKRHGRSGPASPPTNVHASTRVWRTTITKIITQGQEWEHNAKKTPNRKQHGKDGFYTNPKANKHHTSWNHSTDLNPGVWIIHESQWCNKTKSHELTPPASIRECGFNTNPSVHETKAKVQKKPTTGNRNHSTEHKVGSMGATRIPMQQNMQKWYDWYPNRSSKSTTHIVPRKPEKTGRHAKRGKNPKFWKNSKIKTHLAFGFKNPKNPKINGIGHHMKKRPA